MSEYITKFLSLRCAGDVLNVSYPVSGVKKEITEGMAIQKILKSITLKKPMFYNIVELCAGNALPTIISIFTLPIEYAYAIDYKLRKRKWELIKRFHYMQENIYNSERIDDYISEKTILIGMHGCSDLSNQIVDIWNNSKSKILILCPCCNGSVNNKVMDQFKFINQITKYDLWTLELVNRIQGNCKVIKDKNILSPKNNIIVGRKGEVCIEK